MKNRAGIYKQKSTIASESRFYGALLMAGETGFEPATNGFGDHYSTVEPLPYVIKPLTEI